MVKLIIGGTGSGKTKELIDQVNAAVKEEKGSVVCISRGNKLTFDISHAGNYDITRVFIDGLYKIIGGKDAAKAEEFLVALDAFSSKHSVNFTVSLSEEPESATEGMKRFL